MDEQASGGVDTMIVFIAMVLVAATASSMLIQVAQDLQQQAQDTANQALITVSTGLEVVTVIGDRNQDNSNSTSPSETIQVVQLTVKLKAGSNDIDLDNVVISIQDGTTQAELILGTGTNGSHATATTFVYYTLRDTEPTSLSSGNILTEGDLVRIYISCDSAATNLNLAPNTEVNIKMIPQSGSYTLELITTPPTYSSRLIELV